MFLDALMNSLSARTDDQRCLFTLCLLYAIIQNKGTCALSVQCIPMKLSIVGVNRKLLEAFSLLSSPNVSLPF